MSILAAAATAPADPLGIDALVGQTIFAAALILFGVVIGHFLGAYRSGSVMGPPRVGTKVLAVFVVFLVGFLVWFGMQVGFGAIRAIEHKNSGSTEPFGIQALSPADIGFLSTAPFIAGLVVLAAGDRLIGRALPREIGWSLDVLPGGALRGALAMVSVLPLMFGAALVLELLYKAVGYEHPTEHELLTVLGKSKDPLTTALIIGGATLLAPLFEEFLFRGHLQTILVRVFSPRPRRAAAGFPVVPAMVAAPVGAEAGEMMPIVCPAPPPPPPPLATASIEPEPVRPASPGARWAAIAITSLLFAVMHPGWTWPIIFLLSLALGYAYERTANLWVPVTMHLLFNTVQTAFFLLSRMV